MTDQKPKCLLKQRKDDIPKLRAKEKSWHCDTCGALLFADKKPQCVRQRFETARAQVKLEAQRLHIED